MRLFTRQDNTFRCFNSMIVRLKGRALECTRAGRRSFNSMIVRLKDDDERLILRLSSKFQFYDSPIKRTEHGDFTYFRCSFNSMIVRLKD